MFQNTGPLGRLLRGDITMTDNTKASEEFYYRQRGKVLGPFSSDQLSALAKRGHFSRHHQVSADRGVSWQRASEFPEFFPPASVRMHDANPSDTPTDNRSDESDELRLKRADESTNSQSGRSLNHNRPWYFGKEGIENGPFSLAELQGFVRDGTVTEFDLVWREGMPDWVPAQSRSELFERLDPVRIPAISTEVVPLKQTSGMAVASFVLGLLGISLLLLIGSIVNSRSFDKLNGLLGVTLLFLIGSVLAVVFGHFALGRIRDSKGQLVGRGLAIAGLVLGYLVIAPLVVAVIVVFTLSFLNTSTLW